MCFWRIGENKQINEESSFCFDLLKKSIVVFSYRYYWKSSVITPTGYKLSTIFWIHFSYIFHIVRTFPRRDWMKCMKYMLIIRANWNLENFICKNQSLVACFEATYKRIMLIKWNVKEQLTNHANYVSECNSMKTAMNL